MSTQHPTTEERTQHAIRVFKGIEVGLGQADPVAEIAQKLEAQHPGHLILVQAGKFLHGYGRTAYVLHTLKHYKLKLVGTTGAPHLRVGFPAGNFKRRLWPMVADFGVPYVVALGAQAAGHTVYVSGADDSNASLLSAVTDDLLSQVVNDLRQRNELNKAAAKQMLTNPDSSGFHLKSTAQELDYQLLLDIVKMPRDLRATYGENLRACMARTMHAVFAYGMEDNKAAVLRALSADIDLLKHYLTQAPRLSSFKLKTNLEHRAGLAVELGKLVGGLLNAQRPRQ